MKKLLLCVVMAALLFGCSKAPSEDEYAQLQNALNARNDACAENAFADARTQLDLSKQHKQEGRGQDALDAFNLAKSSYENSLADYNNMKNRNDKASSDKMAQQSRMKSIDSDAQKVASKEYAATKARVESLHAQAQAAIDKCDPVAAEGYLASANKEILALENLVSSRMNTTTVTYEVVKGDSLWKIAASQYSNPYFWPLIYWANKASIKDPDLIFPKQQFVIDQNASDATKADADKFARTRGPWSLFDGK